MAISFLRALRITLARRRAKEPSSVRRFSRPGVESLESRQLLHGGPHGGAGTLFDEHTAVMRLVDFEAIHDVAPGGPTTNYFYVAQDPDGDANTPNLWSDLNSWVKATYDPADPALEDFIPIPADRLPSTGDDVEIPHDVSLVYDLGPGSFEMPAPEGEVGEIVSVNDDLRLHSVAVAGSLTFAENTDLLFYFETLVVEPTGSLSINQTDSAHTARLVIAAPDWSQFSLDHAFDTSLDPFQFARGIISHGTVNITGETVTPFITLPQLTRAENNLPSPAKNVRSPAFKFTVPVGVATTGWTVGDRIVVTGTDPNRVNPSTGASSDEEAVISAVTGNADGSTTFTAQVQVAVTQITDMTAPPRSLKTLGGLQYDHAPPLDPSGQPYLNPDGTRTFGVQVANLTRNTIIQSENPYHTTARGHTMFMHNADVSIAGVGFYGLGRSDKRSVVDDVQFYTQEIIDALNQAGALKDPNYEPLPDSLVGQFLPGTGKNPRGRYSVHFHRAGINETDGTDPNHPILKSLTPAEVRDSVVVDSPGWGFVNHTSYVHYDDNVAFNVVGASFVTEVGNELGRFAGNLAIKGVGTPTGEGIESRKVKQDFGFQGDGFWFQGPAVEVENNIAVSQRHSGFIFFTVPLVQNYSWADPASDPDAPTILTARQGGRMTTTMLAEVYDAALIAALGGEGLSLNPGNIPILSFENNTALAVGTGAETWFHQLGATYARELGSQIVGLNVARARGTALFNPYTNLVTIKDTMLIGNPAKPAATGMGRNDVTANFTYDNVTIRGFALGVAIPVNGLDIVLGGTYQNKRNVEITTASSRTRTVLLQDKRDGAGGPVLSPLTFLALPTAADEQDRLNVDLKTSYDPKNRDLSRMFNPDIIRMGTVWLDGFALTGGTGPKQLYYFQQAADFAPFPANDELGQPIDYGGPVLDAFGNLVGYTGIEVPPELYDKTNADLLESYGLAIGGTVAPADSQSGLNTYAFTNPDGTIGQASPRINGLIGSLGTYQPSLDATSARYTPKVDLSPDQSSPQYIFGYKFANPLAATGTTTLTVKIGNFIRASGYAVQLTTLTVNGTPVTIPAPTPPPAPPAGATTLQLANYAKANATYWKNYYNTAVKLSLREGWNVVTGDLDGTGNLRTQLIYGDITGPELKLTSPDKYQLRRLSTDPTNPWAPGTWDQSPQEMTGVYLGSTSSTPVTATVSGQFVAVMNPADLSFGFNMKGQIVDNSFGHKGFEVYISNLKPYLNPSDPSGNLVPYTTPVSYTGSSAANASPYATILDYQSFKDPTAPPVTLAQHLQTIFFAVKDNAGNSKTFALTIFLDPTAPRTGGNSNPSGYVTPSASLIALASQVYVLDLDTFLMIDATKKK